MTEPLEVEIKEPSKPIAYTVLTPRAPYEVVHEGEYPNPQAAFQAAVDTNGGISDGEAASYVVIASKYLKPKVAEVEVKRNLVFS